MMLGSECSISVRQVLWGRRTKRRGFVSLVRHVCVCVHPCMHACVCPRHVLWTRQTKSRDFVSLVRHAHVCMYACMYASMCACICMPASGVVDATHEAPPPIPRLDPPPQVLCV